MPEKVPGGWTERFIKTRSTSHADLEDLFLNCLLRKEVQERFLSNLMTLVSRTEVAIPDHWATYPRSNDAWHKALNLIPVEGWNRMFPNNVAMDVSFRKLVTG